jgi:hypothetical protein
VIGFNGFFSRRSRHVKARRNGEISGGHGGEYEITVFWDVAPCSQALMMEAASTSETLANFN